MDPWNFGRGDGLAKVLAIVLVIVWPLIPVAIVVGIGWYVIRPTIRAAWRHKPTAVVAVVLVALAVRLGVVETAGLTTGLALALAVDLAVWRVASPVTFDRFVAGPYRVRRRRARFVKRWPALMVSHGLGYVINQPRRFRRTARPVTVVPALAKLTTGPHTDQVVVRPLPNQDAALWEKRCDALGLHLGALRCRVAVHDRGHLRLDIQRTDPLAAVIPPFPVPELGAVNLAAIPVGRFENGGVFTIQLGGGRHLFIAGETESGKSSVVWDVIAGAAPLVPAGLMRLWGIDPKCQEFPYGASMFHRLATMADPDAMADVLEDAAETMHAKAVNASGLARHHVPTVDNPLDVVIVDEIGFLTAYFGTAEFRKRIIRALSAIASQGRTTGFHLIGAAQDPGKEFFPLRNLFPARIALRLREASNVDMVLGNGARAAGAVCDEIPESLRGVGYVQLDGVREPQRFRSAYLDDGAVAALAQRYPAMRAPVSYQLIDGQADEQRDAA